MESRLKRLPGVVAVNARLLGENVGEVEIWGDSADAELGEINPSVSAASGPKHNFVVLSIVEER